MLDLIVIVVFGTIFAYFATQNTGGVDIRFAGWFWSQVPLYLIVLGSLLAGLVLASLLYYINSVFTFFKFQSKNSQLRANEKNTEELQAKISRLEAENAQLRESKIGVPPPENNPPYKHTIADRLRERFS